MYPFYTMEILIIKKLELGIFDLSLEIENCQFDLVINIKI